MKKTILLTGATGSVGSETLRELVRRQDRYHIRVFSLNDRSERKILQTISSQTKIVWGDLRNPDDVYRAVVGVDVVLHVAAIIPPLADHQPQLAYDVNVVGTRNLLAAIQAQAIPPRLIFTSSISVYGDRLDNPYIRIGDRLSPSDGDEYARTKIKAEELVQTSGVRWTILRLCGILTPKLKIQPLMFHMPLDTALEWCHNSDAGLALVKAIENNVVIGQIFNLGGGEACRISARNFLHSILPLFGVHPAILPEYAFAIQNFHSGYYADSHKLNDLLGFQRKSLHDYLVELRGMISPLKKLLIRMLPGRLVRDYLLRMSEPLKAVQENNQELITRFYGSREAFENLLNPRLKQKYAMGRKKNTV
jgi:nucleoside-diphosphate-sugar epimerase